MYLCEDCWQAQKTGSVAMLQVDILGTSVHGSGLITQGEAQCLVTATVGRDMEERRTEGILGKGSDRIIVHYNSPIATINQVFIITHASFQATGFQAPSGIRILDAACELKQL